MDWREGEFEVFNFEVEDAHNYYVHAPGGGGDGVLVHNGCGIGSRIKESPRLVKLDEQTGRSHQPSIDHLTKELGKGNLNPGIGTKPIGKGISEARARDGARVYFREVDGKVEVLGKSHKGNQAEVIKEVLKVFGGP